MMFALAKPEMRSYIGQLDKQIDSLDSILRKEISRLNYSCEVYLARVNARISRADGALRIKLAEAKKNLNTIQEHTEAMTGLLESLAHLKQVNKMLTCMLETEGRNLIGLSAFVGPVSNVCLGQLKYIRGRYETTLITMREKVTSMWMDRELAVSLRLILFVNQALLNDFLTEFNRTEVLYADLSLVWRESGHHDHHQFIVLRMISKRFSSPEEQRIIQALFPQWQALTPTIND